MELEPELRSGFNMLLPVRDVHGHVVVSQQMSKLTFGAGETLESYQRGGYYLLHRV